LIEDKISESELKGQGPFFKDRPFKIYQNLPSDAVFGCNNAQKAILFRGIQFLHLPLVCDLPYSIFGCTVDGLFVPGSGGASVCF
jgi:hypothetical protein